MQSGMMHQIVTCERPSSPASTLKSALGRCFCSQSQDRNGGAKRQTTAAGRINNVLFSIHTISPHKKLVPRVPPKVPTLCISDAPDSAHRTALSPRMRHGVTQHHARICTASRPLSACRRSFLFPVLAKRQRHVSPAGWTGERANRISKHQHRCRRSLDLSSRAHE